MTRAVAAWHIAEMMHKISINLPSETLERLDLDVAEYKRSQWLNYAALAMLARLRGGHEAAVEAVGYEHAARALVARGPARGEPVVARKVDER